MGNSSAPTSQDDIHTYDLPTYRFSLRDTLSLLFALRSWCSTSTGRRVCVSRLEHSIALLVECYLVQAKRRCPYIRLHTHTRDQTAHTSKRDLRAAHQSI